MDKKENGYLTVEAALVLPVVLAVQVLVVFLFVFQYNRCLLDQDMAKLAVLGCGAEKQEKSKLAEYVRRCAGDLYTEKYVAWDMTDAEITLQGNSIRVRGSGKQFFPEAGWGILSGGFNWNAETVCEGERLDAVTFIRQYRKWKGETNASDRIYQKP